MPQSVTGPTERGEREPEIVVRLRVDIAQRHRLLEVGQRTPIVVRGGDENAKVVVGFCAPWIEASAPNRL